MGTTPSDMISFTEHSQNGLVYTTAGLLSVPGAVHGFSTRLGGVSQGHLASLNLGASRGDDPEAVRENYRRFLTAVGADPASFAVSHQVHGDTVRTVTAADRRDDPCLPVNYDADGLMTDVPGLALVVFSADCIPVLLLDPVRRCAAAVHAGWRGTALGIAARAALRMREDYGCRPEHIRAAIGPGISPCCFLTRDDVPGALRDGLGSQAETCIRPAEDGRWHVDLKGANALWLRRAGLSPEHIALCPDCTACRTDRFWSHRVMGERRGSMAAIIQLL